MNVELENKNSSNNVSIALFMDEFRNIAEKQPGIIKLKSDIEKLKSESCSLTVITSKDLEPAAKYFKAYKALDKKIEAERKNLVEPLNGKTKEINDYMKRELPFKYSNEMNRLEKEISDWQKMEAEKAKKEAEKKRKEEEEAAIQRAIEIENQQKARKEIIEKIKYRAERISHPVDCIKFVFNYAAELGISLTADEEKYIYGKKEDLETPEIEPDIVPEFIPVQEKISNLNSAGVYTRKYPTWSYAENFSMISFVKSLSDSEIPIYLKVDESAINLFRKTFPTVFEGKSPLKNIVFGYDEKVI